MKTIANIIWFILVGLWTAIGWFLLGCLLCITIIGIPFGRQCFKAAGLTLAPFGKDVNMNFGKHPIANALWAIFFGWELALGYLISGLVFCVTIIGIPVGLQSFKLAKLALFPFGARIVGA